MGWFGYGIYDGDDTQTEHINFIRQAGIEKDEDTIFAMLKSRKTIIPKDKRHLLKTNLDKILKKMPKKIRDEDDALMWQMLLALFLDNGVQPPNEVLIKGIEATGYLLGEHASDFNNPSARRRVLNNFIKKATKVM